MLVPPGGAPRRLLEAERLVPGEADPRGTLALAIVADDAGERLVAVELGSGRTAWATPASAATRAPAWSPDGAQVVFESSAASYRDLWRVDRDGAGLTRLTTAEGGAFDPSPGPAGLLVFASSRTGDAEIWRQDATGERSLTQHRGEDLRPRVDPTGARIAWLRAEPGRLQAWVAAADGRGARRLVEGPEAVDLAWAPGGRRLALAEGQGDAARVVVVDPDGRRGPSTDVPGASGPRWSPDGAWIAVDAARGPHAWVVLWHPASGTRRTIGGDNPDLRHGHPRWISPASPASASRR